VGAARKSSLTLVVLLLAVLIPLAVNTALVLVLHSWTGQVQTVTESWLAGTPKAEVPDVAFASSSLRIEVRTPMGNLPPTDDQLRALDGVLPNGLVIVVDNTYGEEIDVGTTGSGASTGCPGRKTPDGRDPGPCSQGHRCGQRWCVTFRHPKGAPP